MAELEQSRYDQLIRRVGNISAAGAMVREALADLFPVIDVENLPAELFLLSGTRTAFGSDIQAGVGGLFPLIQLFNPAGSNNIITLQSLYVSTNTTMNVHWELTETILTGSVLSQKFRDSRLPIADLAVGLVRSQNSAAPPAGFGIYRVLLDETFPLTDKDGLAVLQPGTGFNIGGSTADTVIRVCFFWRERAAESAELQF